MGHAFHQLYYHFAWATHAREPHIHPSYRAELLRIVNEEAKTRGGWPIRHNAMFDHVHLLVRLPPTVAASDFIGQVKGATAFRVNRERQTAVRTSLAGRLRRAFVAQRRGRERIPIHRQPGGSSSERKAVGAT